MANNFLLGVSQFYLAGNSFRKWQTTGCYFFYQFYYRIHSSVARSEASISMRIFLFRSKNSSVFLFMQIYLNFQNAPLHSIIHTKGWFFYVNCVSGWAILKYQWMNHLLKLANPRNFWIYLRFCGLSHLCTDLIFLKFIYIYPRFNKCFRYTTFF